MLQDIRDRSTGPVAWIIIALLVVPFALWGINSYFTGGGAGQNDVAKVGGQSITKNQLQRAYNKRFRRMRQVMGKRFDPDMIKPKALRRQVLQSLIRRSLLIQYAHDQGYRVTDKDVLSYLQQIPAFQENGKFSSSKYTQVLKRVGIPPVSFENNIRQTLLISQLSSGVTQSTVVTADQVDQAYRLQHERRSLAYLVFQADSYHDKVRVTDKQIKQYYKSHGRQYKTPEKVKLAYIDLDRSKMQPDQPASKADLKEIYDTLKSRFTTPAKRKARHILIKVAKGESGKAAKARAEKIRKEIENGKSFADMARKYSQDAGSSAQGGQLGWIGPKDLSKPFENVLYHLKKGQVSQPVRTQYGWHLIKLEAVRPAKTKVFTDPQVQKTLKNRYRQNAVKQRFEHMSQTLGKLSFEKPDSLKPVAKKLGLKIQETGWITQHGQHDGIAGHKKVLKAAFSDLVLKQRVNSEPIDLSSGRILVVRVADHQPSKILPLKQVKARIKKDLLREEAVKMAHSRAEQALSDAQGGVSLAKLKKKYSGSLLENPGYAGRRQKGVNAAVLDKAFSMAHHNDKKKTGFALASMGNGNTAVVALKGVRYGDPSKASDQQRGKLRQTLARQQAAAEFSSYMDSIRKQTKVKILDKDLRPGASS